MLLYIFLSIFAFCIAFIGLERNTQTTSDESLMQHSARKTAAINKSLTTLTTALFIVTIWILTAFRAPEIGNDTRVYIQYFELFAQNGIDTSRSFELGYQILNVLIGKFTNDPHVFLIIVAILTYAGTFICIFKESKNIQVSTCLFFAVFFSLYTSVLRQSIAIVFTLYGFLALKNNHKALAAMLFALASSFHFTAISCFLLFVHPRWYNNRVAVFALTIACLALSYFGVLDPLVSLIAPRYSHYFSSRYASTGWLAISYTLLKNLFLYYIASQNTQEYGREELSLAVIVLLSVFASFGFSVNLFTRAGYYFDAMALIEIPNLLIKKNIQNRRVIMLLLCVAALLMFLITLMFRPTWNHLYPYMFWH